MTPIFTIHAGEYLVGEFIHGAYKNLSVWIPAKDTGIDLLVTNEQTKKRVSLQVKMSRVYKVEEAVTEFDKKLVAGGFFTLDASKIEKSSADYWVFVLVSLEEKLKPQYIVFPPLELRRRLSAIHGKGLAKYPIYLWVTKGKAALDGRGLKKADREALAQGTLELGDRDFSAFLDDWSCLDKLASDSRK